MIIGSRRLFSKVVCGVAVAAAAFSLPDSASADRPVVPGTGKKVTRVGDTFEDPNWKYYPQLPKSSRNIDGQRRHPTGRSHNGRFIESSFRGAPDQVERVATPEGGIPGSKASLLLRTRDSGIPGRTSTEAQQDDFLLSMSARVGAIGVEHTPSATVRVYIPPFEQFDQVTGSSFGIRLALKTEKTEKKEVGWGIFRRNKTVTEPEEYWPGFFLAFRSKNDPKYKEDSVVILIRGNASGNEVLAQTIKTPGWYTFGMSCTPDGQVHFYASPGVDNLTAKDHLYSSFPYSYRAQRMSTFFFNVVSRDNGRDWSTPWIIDDPSVYTTTGRF